MKDFTVITNSIGQLIQNDAEITQYCIDNLGRQGFPNRRE